MMRDKSVTTKTTRRSAQKQQGLEEAIETVRRLNDRHFAGLDRAFAFRDHLRSQTSETTTRQPLRRKSASTR